MVAVHEDQNTATPGNCSFTVSQSPDAATGPRLGCLRLRGRKAIQTPHYVAVSSRGAVPHLSQDTYTRDTSISGIYVALEDFIEKAPPKTPPIYSFRPKDDASPLRRFIALPDESIMLLGARRMPPVPSPNANTHTSVSIMTSVGVRSLTVEEYTNAAANLDPDIVIALGDVPFGVEKISRKKTDKITSRTEKWMTQQVQIRSQVQEPGAHRDRVPALFAPLLPISTEAQGWYLDHLKDLRPFLDGLAVYSPEALVNLPDHFSDLPKISLTEPSTPLKLLQEVRLGVDIFTVPFIGAATDAGIALDFSFPPEKSAFGTDAGPQPLGVDMWQTAHATSLGPLREGCTCYACTKHHRAYLQHLLMAKEMLGWVLLQVHNHHVMDEFFSGIRQSIATKTFEADCAAFGEYYEPELPEKTGQGPRVRGYQFRSEGPGETKKNPAGYKALNDASEPLAKSPIPDQGADAKELEEIGFGEETQRLS